MRSSVNDKNTSQGSTKSIGGTRKKREEFSIDSIRYRVCETRNYWQHSMFLTTFLDLCLRGYHNAKNRAKNFLFSTNELWRTWHCRATTLTQIDCIKRVFVLFKNRVGSIFCAKTSCRKIYFILSQLKCMWLLNKMYNHIIIFCLLYYLHQLIA